MGILQRANHFYLKTVESISKGLSRPVPGVRRGNAMSQLVNYPHGSPVWTALNYNRLNYVNQYKGWVYVAVRAIAEKVSQLKPSVGIVREKSIGTKSKRYISKSMRERLKSTTSLRDSEDIEPIDQEHPLVRLLDDPNEPETASMLWYRTLLFWELCGKAYWWTPRNNAGMPCEIWVIPTHWVTPLGGNDQIIGSYRIQPVEGSYKALDIPAEDMIELLHPSPLSIVDGYSPLEGGSAWIDIANSIDSSQWHQMQNAHNAGMLLGLKEGTVMPSVEDINAAYNLLANRLQGAGNNRMPLILPPQWVSYGRYGLTAEELDYGASDDRARDKALTLYRVPKGALGIEPGTANTSAYAPLAQFFEFCINPKLNQLGETATEKLARQFDPKIKIFWENAAPIDPQLELQRWQFLRQYGDALPNETRQYMGLDPIDGGDDRIIPSGWVPAEFNDAGMEPLVGNPQPTTDQLIEQDKEQPPQKEPQKLLTKSVTVPDNAIKVPLPNVRQETEFSCGVACLESVARFYGVGADDESWYRDQMTIDPEVGVQPAELRRLADKLGLITIMGAMDAENLRNYLDQCIPVVLLIQAWGEVQQYDSDDNGHYVVAIGYDEEEVIVEDPVLRITRGYIGWDELESRWHGSGADEQHWAMAVYKPNEMKARKGFSANGKVPVKSKHQLV